LKCDLSPPGLQIFGQANDANGSASSSAPRILRDLGQRLQRTYCSAARGAVEVLQAPEEGTPVQDGSASWLDPLVFQSASVSNPILLANWNGDVFFFFV